MGRDATIRIDQIGFDNAGPLEVIPEPGAVAMLALGGFAALAHRRRA